MSESCNRQVSQASGGSPPKYGKPKVFCCNSLTHPQLLSARRPLWSRTSVKITSRGACGYGSLFQKWELALLGPRCQFTYCDRTEQG